MSIARPFLAVVAICGYYTRLAMELNVARYKVPDGDRTLPRLTQ